MVCLSKFVALAVVLASSAAAFPAFPDHASLAGLSREVLDKVVPTLPFHQPENPPGPLKFNGTKLVNDKAHPWKAPQKGDIRGPCPGLNTLASHGYLPRNGIATTTEIINAVQEGFNMANDIAKLITFAAFLVDGNIITGKLSIGGKSPKTGPDPPPPASVAGLDTHSLLEGDASMTRADAFFGDDHSFNQTLFDEFTDFCNRFGAGKYNLTVAAEYRFRRIQDSIATNPTFSFVAPRYFTAYAESVFPLNFFIDGRHENGQLDIDVARSFFRDMQYPKDFYRASKPSGGEGMDQVFAPHPIPPGANVGGINNYVPDPTSADFTSPNSGCLLYENFVNRTVVGLYPNPTGVLRKTLNIYLNIFYNTVGPPCTQVFPYGKDD